MSFETLANLFNGLENMSSSLAMIDLLAEFFARAKPREARMAAYLLKGRVAPDYKGSEFGLGRKLVMRVLAERFGKSPKAIDALFAKTGDLGDAAEALMGSRRSGGMALQEVFDALLAIAAVSGNGSQEMKMNMVGALLSRSSAREARYLIRILLGTLRLGVGEMTFLNGLSKGLTGSKEKKKILEDAYNVVSDLGEVAYQAVEKGVDALLSTDPVMGVPLRMMLAQRIKELSDVQAHMPGDVIVEYKYDGERIQAHILGKGEVVLYSRRHENITDQFPDVVRALMRSFRGRDAIVEGEVVAVDTATGRLKDFQTLMQRRRKYDIDEYVKKIPVKYILFDIVRADGRSLLQKPLTERRDILRGRVFEKSGIAFAVSNTTNDMKKVEQFFIDAVADGAEGVMIKDAQGIYEAGTRGWRWIKFKKDYQEGMTDTFDLVVVGGLFGSGRRAGTYGSLLAAAYDPKTDTYYSFTKVGAGFTDKNLGKLRALLNPHKLRQKHRSVETGMDADVWFEPVRVVEVAGAEITVSPVHTVARDRLKKGGLALRFPRFIRWREDKTSEQATSVKEIFQMYQLKRKK